MDLMILGAGGHAKVIVDAVQLQNQYSIIGFIDENKFGGEFCGFPIHAAASSLSRAHFVVAIGDNKTRREKYETMISLGWEPATVIHPSSVLASDVSVGDGTVIFAGSVINSSSRIGANCIINTATSIDHDCLIDSHVHIAPGCHLAGQVTVGEGAFLGIGTVSIPQVTIGSWATCGAGSVILKNVAAGTTVVGVPARQLE